MTTQVIFNIDKQLKERAMKKAQREGVPFSSVLKFATKSYVDGDLAVGIVKQEKFNAKTSREIRKALQEIKQRKGLSPVFDNAEDAIAYLRKL